MSEKCENIIFEISEKCAIQDAASKRDGEAYEAKGNGKVNSGRILMIFRSIVSQLAEPNEKFIYRAVREGARARDYEEAIEWLVSTSAPSFKKYVAEHRPEHAIRFSTRGYRKDEDITNLPLYLADKTKDPL